MVDRHQYHASDVLRVLGVKPHVLRYWEQVLPLIRPTHDHSGHRVWSAAQVRMLVRLRHMVVRRGMSVQAAGDALLRAGEPQHADAAARLAALRARMVSLLLVARGGVFAPHDGASRPAAPTAPAPSGTRADEGLSPAVYDLRAIFGDRFGGEAGGGAMRERARVGRGAATVGAVVSVPISHLFAGGDARRAAWVTAQLLRHRVADDTRLVVPVPRGARGSTARCVRARSGGQRASPCLHSRLTGCGGGRRGRRSWS